MSHIHYGRTSKVVAALLAVQLLGIRVAAADREEPLLANERHLLVDTEATLLGAKRENLGVGGMDAELLLETTYDTPGKNLLLDTNLMFEEALQEELERSPEIEQCAENATVFITRNLPMAPANSLATVRTAAADQRNNWRQIRIDWICDPTRMNCAAGAAAGGESAGTILTETAARDFTTDQHWKDAYAAHCVATGSPGSTASSLDWAGGVDASAKKANCVSYGKMLKMLYTQYPYFGGSADFKNKELNLEYWLYQLSTLTKDPGRAGPAASESPKAILDYVTPAGSLVPKNNPRNLGLGMTDGPGDKMGYDKLPGRIRDEIFFALNSKVADDPRWLALERQKPPAGDGQLDTFKKMAAYWDALDDSQRKRVYGDILLMPWSFAHMKNSPEPWDAESNVAGVRGNILLKPAKARELYLQDFTTGPAPRNKRVDQPINWGSGNEETVTHWADEFERLHTDWYAATRAAYQPIIGGMSGHTLGYLNTYVAALTAVNQRTKTGVRLFDHTTGTNGVAVTQNLCTLERFRAVMLAGLIGNKRHHSYTEVMTASVGFSWPWTTDGVTETLAYAHRNNYRDLFASGDDVIKGAAMRALKRARQSYALQAPANSVFRLIEQWGRSRTWDKRPQDEFAIGKNPTDLDAKLSAYLSSNIGDDDTASKATAVERAVIAFITQGGAKPD